MAFKYSAWLTGLASGEVGRGGAWGSSTAPMGFCDRQRIGASKDHDCCDCRQSDEFFHPGNMTLEGLVFYPESPPHLNYPRAGCGAVRLSRLSSKNGRPRVNGFPTKEIIGAGPGVDFGLANPAFEFAGMLVGMLLSCCGIIHPATGAGKFFGGPDAVCHRPSMRQRRRGSSLRRPGG
jgi:hypothetical protein